MVTGDEEVQWAYLLSPMFQIENTKGVPVTGGWLEVYIHGTRNKYYCAKDFDGTLHPFKIPLDGLGANIVLASPAHAYDVYAYNKYGSLVMSRYNIVPATGDGSIVEDVVTLTSNDGTVDIFTTDQTNWDLSIKDTTDQVAQNTSDISDIKDEIEDINGDIEDINSDINDINGDINDINGALANKKNVQQPYSAAGSVTKTITNISQDANGKISVTYSNIDLPPEVPNVNIISTNGSINIASGIDVESNTKTFDIDVNIDDPLEYGQFRATNVSTRATLNKIKGNLNLNNNAIALKKGNSYHFTLRGTYVPSTASNTYANLTYIEYSAFQSINVNVDNTITQSQSFEISYDVYNLNSDIDYIVAFAASSGTVSELWVEVHNLNGVSINGGSGSGDNDKVAVDSETTPGYLEDVLVSDSDLVSLIKSGNKLHVQVNTEYSADPKLSTLDEAAINGATSNYGSYALNEGQPRLIWNDTSYTSYPWLNASVIQMKRLCTAQGTITKCNMAICGSVSLETPPAFINCGVFSSTGTLLGSTGLRFYGTDFTSGTELVTFDMTEATEGSLNLQRNTYYIIQIVTCGLQLASLSHADNYNYTYDVGLRMNMEGTVSQPVWTDTSALVNKATQVPWISFAAAPHI